MTAYRNRRIDPRLPVEVYRNLHRAGVSYSVRQVDRVVAHVDTIALRNVLFIVRRAGHARAIATGVRNVHAWVRGYLSAGPRPANWGLDRIRYDLTHGVFRCGDDSVYSAAYVLIGSGGVFAALRDASFNPAFEVDTRPTRP